MHNKYVCSSSSKDGSSIGVNNSGRMQSNAGAFASSSSALNNESFSSVAGNCSNDVSDSLHPDSVSGTEYDVLQKHPENSDEENGEIQDLQKNKTGQSTDSDEVEAPQEENGELRTMKRDLEKNEIRQSTSSDEVEAPQKENGELLTVKKDLEKNKIGQSGTNSYFGYNIPALLRMKAVYSSPWDGSLLNIFDSSLSPRLSHLVAYKEAGSTNWLEEEYDAQLHGMGVAEYYESVREQRGLPSLQELEKQGFMILTETLPTVQGSESLSHMDESVYGPHVHGMAEVKDESVWKQKKLEAGFFPFKELPIIHELEKEGFEYETLSTVQGSEKQKGSKLPQQKENRELRAVKKGLEKNEIRQFRPYPIQIIEESISVNDQSELMEDATGPNWWEEVRSESVGLDKVTCETEGLETVLPPVWAESLMKGFIKPALDRTEEEIIVQIRKLLTDAVRQEINSGVFKEQISEAIHGGRIEQNRNLIADAVRQEINSGEFKRVISEAIHGGRVEERRNEQIKMLLFFLFSLFFLFRLSGLIIFF